MKTTNEIKRFKKTLKKVIGELETEDWMDLLTAKRIVEAIGKTIDDCEMEETT